MADELSELVRILGISEEEAIKAILSAFSPCQPSSIRQAWSNRKNYQGNIPTTEEIWALFESADFRCTYCGSQHRITLDHINSNSTDHRLENLQVLCADCNRAKSKFGMRHKDTNVRVLHAVLSLYREANRFPTNSEIVRKAGIERLGGTTYLVRYLEKRLTNRASKLKHKTKPIRTSITQLENQ